MNSLVENWDGTVYPDMIRDLPEINIQVEGIRGWLLQGGDRQVIFFDIQPVGEIPPHTHCAQWGIMLKGEMSLTIDGATRVYRKGDWYYIPGDVMHSANFLSHVNVIDVFDAPDRYSAK
jgi:quercetin dioxygenase-like cupin family protein